MALLAMRWGIAGACCLGIWSCYKIARADHLFRRDTAQSVRAAIALVPDQSKYYARLAQLEPDRAEELLEKTLAINRYDSKAAIDLALIREARGDPAGAEKLLLEAFAVDRTYLTRWTLANYYFRHDDSASFWKWARKAAEMPAEDITPLFQLCWRVIPHARDITNKVLTDDPATIRQLLGFLASKGEFQEAAAIAHHLTERGQPDPDRAILLSLVDKLIAGNDASEAQSVWQLLADRRWIVAESTLPDNPSFGRPPLQAGFDWRLPSSPGLHSWPGPSGLEVEFSGKQPESCVIAEQIMPLSRGEHEFRYRYRTSGIAPGTGLRWRVMAAESGANLATSSDLSHDAVVDASVPFRIPENTALVRLRLEYARALGTPRIAGRVLIVTTAAGVL